MQEKTSFAGFFFLENIFPFCHKKHINPLDATNSELMLNRWKVLNGRSQKLRPQGLKVLSSARTG
ncbi:unnamed protein product, partial [Allacma fusca]